MSVGKIIFVNGGEQRLRESGGVWLGNHHTILVKHEHVPDPTDTTVGALTNICDSANYAPEDITGKAFVNGSADMNSIDHTNAGADVMNCRYMYFAEDVAANQSGATIVIGYVDLTGADANGDLGGPIAIDVLGAITYTEV